MDKEKKARIFCLIAGILAFVGAALAYYVAVKTGIVDITTKVGSGCLVVCGVVLIMTAFKKKDKTDK